jgi:chromosome segregation ATPase
MIREVQLSNFMSYRNASVPLEPGLNLIVGPNGAGKSSILLAISVVLGQAYTERARKLSELIRWGEQEARVSIKLDNNTVSGSRPFPQARTDEILLTRVLKRKGDYLYLLNNKPISKTDLAEGLSRIGLNPDNMLVIMHQLMVGRFGSVSPVEKLLLLEDAIGFGDYRKDVLEASSRLRKLSTERETMASILEGTRETFEHWQREYEKYEMKKKLEAQLKDLQRELVWRRILRRESSQNRLKDRISSLQKDVDQAREDFQESAIQHSKVSEDVNNLNQRLEAFRNEQLQLEHGRGFRSGALHWIERVNQVIRSQEKLFRSLRDAGGIPEEVLLSQGDELKKALADVQHEQEIMQVSSKQDEEGSEKIRKEMSEVSEILIKSTDSLVQSRVRQEVSTFKTSLLTEQIKDLEVQLRTAVDELAPLKVQASQLGAPFDNPRELQVVTLDLASVEEKLRPLSHLSDEVERMFKTYGDMYEDMKKKTTVVEHNRAEVLNEFRERYERWKSVMEKMFEELSGRYNALLADVGGKGIIMLKASKDIEKAGLELHAGFKGNNPVSLDGLAPSGGERTIALVAFLLSLQQYVASPFRAIDEFDVHMDPKNRETISRLIYAVSSSTEAGQYVAITPGQVTLPGERNVHVIVVQNVEGSSLVKELK